jgi:hypothetical protein
MHAGTTRIAGRLLSQMANLTTTWRFRQLTKKINHHNTQQRTEFTPERIIKSVEDGRAKNSLRRFYRVKTFRGDE